MIRTLRLAGPLLIAFATAAHAEPAAVDPRAVAASAADPGPEPGDVDDDGRHYLAAATWAALELAIPAAYYWSTQSDQEVDWTRPSLRDKLTLKAFSFDTNAFHVNAIRHPLTGVGDYQFARSNGFGVVGSTIAAYAAGIVWELAVEYHEDPAINDIVMNGAGGLAIGEPLYQIGQLWRGGELSIADRIRSAAFSPFAATQDLWRSHRSWLRRRAWSDFAFTTGALSHRLENGSFRDEVAVGLDIDVVRHPGFVVPGEHDGKIATGAWSRVAIGGRIGRLGADGTGDLGLVSTTFRSRTSLTGRYTQDAEGNGRLLALGTAFTYHRDRLGEGADHVAIAHLIGPQLQLSRRTGTTAVRWDTSAYGDFGLIDAYVFGPRSPLPPPPPYLSTLQVNGYYDAAGASLESRLRIEHGAWRADMEVAGHRLWSLDFADRAAVDSSDVSRTPVTAATAQAQIPATPHGVSDLRVYSHAELGVHGSVFGIAVTGDATYRDGAWRDLERSTTDWTVGVLATANL